MGKPASRVRCKLSQPVTAVELQEHPGSSLKSPTDMVVRIPPDAVIELEGAVAPSGLINVVWDGHAFSVFYEDLKTSGQLMEAATER
jgi:hypothetical protein